MSDTFITVIAILLAVVLLVVVPLQVTSQRVDTMSKLDVDTLTSDFVEQIRTTGSLTKDDYSPNIFYNPEEWRITPGLP